MIVRNLSIKPYQIKDITTLDIDLPGAQGKFPFLTIDRDSYIIGGEVHSGISFDVYAGRHCIAIGRGCSLADSITFMLDVNHDYGSIAQGEPAFLKERKPAVRIKRKGSVILQNDVWVGHGATILAGVTLHNGCVVAADAVVTKDVPPYAIVGGNPAEILKYRFDENTVSALQRIAWWDWPEEIQRNRRDDFSLTVNEFVRKYLPCADNYMQYAPPSNTAEYKKVVLFAVDIGEPYPLYAKIMRQYFEKDRPNTELLLYLPEECSSEENIAVLEEILQKYSHRDCYVTLQAGVTIEEPILFQGADYFVTTRCRQTVRRTCLADLYGVQVLYGTDEPLFPTELE